MLNPAGAGTTTGMFPGVSPVLWGAAKAEMARERKATAEVKNMFGSSNFGLVLNKTKAK